jgi:hypothetical protein
MPLSSSLTAVRWYTQADPYYYTVDNRPLEDLAARDTTLANELDKRVNMVKAVGSAAPALTSAPAGWTIALNGTGDYTITHTLGTASLTAVGSAEGTLTFVTIFSISSTQIRVRIYDAAGVLTHSNFSLLVSQYA